MSDCRELCIDLPDGYPAFARYWPAPPGAPAVLHLHGIQSHTGWYTATAQAINAAGFAVLQADRRGSGRNARERGHADSAGQLIADGAAYARRLRELSGARRVHVIGVSWGGKLAAALHVTEPELAASLTLVAPGIFPIVDVTAAEKFRIGWSMVAEPHKLYPIPLNDWALFTDDPERIHFLENDALTLHEATAGFYLASRRMDKIWRNLGEAPPRPIHLLLAGQERIIDNARTRGFIEALPWPQRRISDFPQSRHTIEYGPQRDRFVAELIDFLRTAEETSPTAGPPRA